MREIVFGEDYAYLPMTQSGAMGAGDTLRVMRQCPHFRDFLPNDAHGRTVACSDWTTFRPSDLCEGNRYDPVRIHWYVLHLALKRKSTIEKGIVFIIQTDSNYKLKYFDRIRVKLMREGLNECFPVDLRASHLIISPSSLIEILLPSVMFILRPKNRLRLYIHRQSGTRLSHELEDFGFERRNLPKSMGGIFEWNPNWVNEQREREDDA